MSANKSDPGRLPPTANAEYPDAIESDAVPALGRNAPYLREERISNGGLADDPTDSGDPVRNKHPFKDLTGGR